MEMISITQCFKQIYTKLRLTAISTGGDYKINTTEHTRVTFMHLWFNTASFKNYLSIYFWLCWVFIVVQGPSLVAGHGPLIEAASLVSEHKLQGMWTSVVRARASVVEAHWLQSTGSVVVAHRLSWNPQHWNLPGPGTEPMSPTLAGRFLTNGPPGKF